MLLLAIVNAASAAHYGTIKECEVLEKVEQLRNQEKNKEALEYCSLKLQELDHQPIEAFYLKIAHEKGGVLFALGDFEASRDFLRPLKNLPNRNSEEYKSVWADCMYALAKAYDWLDNSDSSIYFFRLALNTRLDLQFPDYDKLSDNYSYLGYMYRFAKGDRKMAEQYYLKEQEALQKFNADAEDWSVHYLNLGATLSHIDRERALNYYFKALEKTQRPEVRVNCHTNIANIFIFRNDYQEAIKHYRHIFNAIPKEEMEQPWLYDLFENFGFSFYEEGIKDSALFYINKSFNGKLKEYGYHSKPVAEAVYMLLVITDEAEKASELKGKLLKLGESLYSEGDNELDRIYRCIGEWYFTHDQPDSALYYLQKGVRGNTHDLLSLPDMYLLETYGSDIAYSVKLKSYLLFDCALDKPSLDYLKASISHFKLLSEMYDFLLYNRSSEFEQLDFVSGLKAYYDKAIEASTLLYKAGEGTIEDVWYFMEKSKAAILALQASEASVEVASLNEEDLISNRRILIGKRKQLQQIQGQNEVGEDSLRLALFNLDKEIDSITKVLKNKGLLVELRRDGTISLKELREKYLQEDNKCLIQIHTTDKALYILKVDKNSHKLLVIEGESYKSIQDNTASLLNMLNRGFDGSNPKVQYKDYTQAAYNVYKYLFAPLGVSAKAQVTIVPEGFFNGLPFEVLISEKPKGNKVNYRSLSYLMKLHTMNYGYSASWLVSSESNSSDGMEYRGLLAFAYGGGGKQDGYSSLPASEAEVKDLERVWPLAFRSFVGDAATEENFKANAENFGFIHLAIHNKVDVEDPLNNGLIFRPGKHEDGVLHLHEIYQLIPNAKMVVLSACESAIGEYNTGEGYLSVGRAFAQRGTPCIISSLWKASDNHSMSIMTSFYKELEKDFNTTVALNSARQQFLEKSDELTAHPANWAGFIIYGSALDIPLEPKTPLVGYLPFMAIALLFLLAFLVYRYKAKFATR